MTAKTEDSPQAKLELRFLSDYVHCPVETREAAAKYMVEDDAFTQGDHRAVWRQLNNAVQDNDDVARLECVARALKLDGPGKDDFLELGALTPELIAQHAHDLAMLYYGRRLGTAARMALSRVDDCADGESLLQKVNLAMGEIPRPPHIGTGNESEYAARLLQESEADIPDKLLHRPGFIDEVVEHALKAAYKPNRTLAFAGALALTAHLMGRRYTDMRDTRSNLFVFALGPTGIGKDCPRRVSRNILRECDLSNTVFDQVASGEVIEELLFRFPCTLLQMDEIQKLLQALKDERNATMLGLAKFLMTLYTASGGDHTMRPKASDPQSIGRVIADPSLTVFATGISRDSFKALTPSVIKEGLLGRCLMLDSEIEGEPNTFPEGRPKLTHNIIAMAQEMAGAGGGLGSMNATSHPVVVPYADGIGERINAINSEITRRKKACHKRLDEIGEALWARASEKVSKLALISAVSATRERPVIRTEDVEWAWEFVQCLVQRMVRRVDSYMTNGKVDEICQKIIEFLVTKGGTCTRRELFRAKKLEDGPDFAAAERTLIARGQISKTETGKHSVVYHLVDQK